MKQSGVSVVGKKGLDEWSSLLAQWVKLTNKYCQDFDGTDAPYYYNERASISILSGAAWTNGWISLEEFQQEKKTNRKWLGRADLYVSSPKIEYYVEAKFKHASLQSRGGVSEIARGAIQHAIADSQATSKGSGGVVIAVAFIPVRISVNRLQKSEVLVEKAISEMLGAGFHALAWTFPPSMKEPHDGAKYAFPGAFLAAVNGRHWSKRG